MLLKIQQIKGHWWIFHFFWSKIGVFWSYMNVRIAENFKKALKKELELFF